MPSRPSRLTWSKNFAPSIEKCSLRATVPDCGLDENARQRLLAVGELGARQVHSVEIQKIERIVSKSVLAAFFQIADKLSEI